MHNSRGYSTIEMFLFVFILGILLFLAVPFIRQINFDPTSSAISNKPPLTVTKSPSNFTLKTPKNIDTNHSSSLSVKE
jgi:hypothetical protein